VAWTVLKKYWRRIDMKKRYNTDGIEYLAEYVVTAMSRDDLEQIVYEELLFAYEDSIEVFDADWEEYIPTEH
jgi:hypothetical protein